MNLVTNYVEQRKDKRHKAEIQVSVHTKNERISGTLLNISMGGFKMISEKGIDLNTTVVVELDSLVEYAFKGTVKWCSQEKQEQKTVKHIGVKIEDIIWTNLKITRTVKWGEFVKEVVSEIASNN